MIDFIHRAAALLRADDVPRREHRVGFFQHFVVDAVVFLVVLVAVLVALRHAPAGVFVAHEFFLPVRLLLGGDVQEKLDDEIAVLRQLPLKRVDALHAAVCFVNREIVFQTGAGDLRIPALVKNRHLSALRRAPPVPPQKRIALFLRRGILGVVDLEEARVECLNHAGNHASFAGRIPALKQNDDRQLALLHAVLELGKLPAHLARFQTVFNIRHVAVEIDVIQHKDPPLSLNVTIDNSYYSIVCGEFHGIFGAGKNNN